MIYYINACARSQSRTNRLAKAVLASLGEYTELCLNDLPLLPLNEQRLAERTALIEQGNTGHPMFELARQFAGADTIVMAAPYWDGSFPAVLKTYLENIYVTGIVSQYGPDGRPQGLCRARKLIYVTTAGGPYNPAFSYHYIQDLAVNMFGIAQTQLVFAEGLDIVGNNAEELLQEAMKPFLP